MHRANPLHGLRPPHPPPLSLYLSIYLSIYLSLSNARLLETALGCRRTRLSTKLESRLSPN